MKAWTYSHIEKFETCPKQFYHTTVVRDFVSPPTEQSLWGQRVHTAFENRVKDGTALPEGMEHWEPIAKKIEEIPGVKFPEVKMAVSKAFQKAEWDSAWSRGIADLVVINEDRAMVLDYKTGKRKPSDQLALYAAYTFAHYPEINKVDTRFVWLKNKKIDKEQFSRDDVSDIWRKFVPKVARIESSHEREVWPPKPSGLCNGWCPVKTCPYYKERR